MTEAKVAKESMPKTVKESLVEENHENGSSEISHFVVNKGN